MKIHPTSSSISIGSSRGGGGVSTVEIYIYICTQYIIPTTNQLEDF